MRFALGELHWSPDEFWKSTPMELLAAWKWAHPEPERISRENLDALMEKFPDVKE